MLEQADATAEPPISRRHATITRHRCVIDIDMRCRLLITYKPRRLARPRGDDDATIDIYISLVLLAMITTLLRSLISMGLYYRDGQQHFT